MCAAAAAQRPFVGRHNKPGAVPRRLIDVLNGIGSKGEDEFNHWAMLAVNPAKLEEFKRSLLNA